MILQVTAPHFCAGIEVGVLAAPIIRYMETWDAEMISAYCLLKGWRLTTVENNE